MIGIAVNVPALIAYHNAGAQKGDKVLRHERPSPPCPRCCSQETKFCYYNNYNVKQPRYFCKVCFLLCGNADCLGML